MLWPDISIACRGPASVNKHTAEQGEEGLPQGGTVLSEGLTRIL